MAIDNGSIVTVLNYQSCRIIANSKVTSYEFDPVADDGTPTMHSIPFVEVKQIHSSSNVFKEGFLCFEKNEAEEIYAALGVRDHDKILYREDIKEIILNPTKEGLQKFLDIKTSSYFDRVMGVFTGIMQSKAFDISIRVKELIEKRYAEIRSGILQTKLVLSNIHNEKAKIKKIDELEKQLEETQRLLQQLQAKQSDPIEIEKQEELREAPASQKNKKRK